MVVEHSDVAWEMGEGAVKDEVTRAEWAEKSKSGTQCTACSMEIMPTCGGAVIHFHVWRGGKTDACCGNDNSCDLDPFCQPIEDAPTRLLVERDAALAALETKLGTG